MEDSTQGAGVPLASDWTADLPVYDDGRPIVRISLDEEKTADDAVRVLAARCDVFVRLGTLVRVMPSHPTTGPGYLAAMKPATVRELLASSAVFAWDTAKGWRRDKCPAFLVPAIQGRGRWSSLHQVIAVVHTPVFQVSGALHQTPGLDPMTGAYYDPLCPLPDVPDAPTHAQAKAAAALVEDFVKEFPFATPSDLAGWLAAFLTPFVQYAYSGPSPMFLIDKNSPGIGASKLCDVISIVHAGFSMDRSTFPEEENELQKTISGYVLEGERWCMLDNLRGKVGGSVIEIALTAERWKARLLGTNSNVRGRLDMIWFATANNAQLTPDVARRTLQIRLESVYERPDELEYKRPNLLDDVHVARASLVSAGLTMLRAYFAAGSPSHPDLRPWGSFDGWSRLVQGCLLWLGYEPLTTNRLRLRADADNETALLHEVLSELRPVFKDRSTGKVSWLTTHEIIQRVNADGERFRQLKGALENFTMTRPNEPLSVRRLGNAFVPVRNKPCGGLRLVRSADRKNSGYEWFVETIKTDAEQNAAVSSERALGAGGPPPSPAPPEADPGALDPFPDVEPGWTPEDDPTLD